MAGIQPEVLLNKDGLQDTGILEDRKSAVCLIKNNELMRTRHGSGFFSKVTEDSIGDVYGVFTCNHVLGSKSEAKAADVVFGYERNTRMPEVKVKLDPEFMFRTNKELDYSFIAIKKEDIANLKSSSGHQIVPIILEPEPEARKDDIVMIFQHPRGQPKQWSVNTIVRVWKPFVFYKVDTEPGSSGSPVLTFAGHKLIAIHNKGKEGDCNRGTLCREVLSHMKTGYYTRPVTPTGSSDKPSDQFLNEVSTRITQVWKSLGRVLKVPENCLEEIENNNVHWSAPREKSFQMLKAWKNRGELVTYGELYWALNQVGLNDLVEELRKM